MLLLLLYRDSYVASELPTMLACRMSSTLDVQDLLRSIRVALPLHIKLEIFRQFLDLTLLPLAFTPYTLNSSTGTLTITIHNAYAFSNAPIRRMLHHFLPYIRIIQRYWQLPARIYFIIDCYHQSSSMSFPYNTSMIEDITEGIEPHELTLNVAIPDPLVDIPNTLNMTGYHGMRPYTLDQATFVERYIQFCYELANEVYPVCIPPTPFMEYTTETFL